MMLPVPDYRTLPYDIANVRKSGEYLGRGAYRKLYVIENTMRVVIHSVLGAQIGITKWWGLVVDPNTMKIIQNMKKDYRHGPGPSIPGVHDIYYLYLPNLTKIANTNSHLFRPVIQNIDQWVTDLDRIRLPRNIVGHMNWLHMVDENEIHKIYISIDSLIGDLHKSGIPVLIP